MPSSATVALGRPARGPVGATRTEEEPKRLSFRQLVAMGFPALPHSFIALPFNIVIPAFYAAHTAITLVQIGFVTGASRLLDAVFDPLVGFFSDRLETPWGHRKPWVLAASVVCSIALFFFFQPPKTATIVYYGLWSFLLYAGFSLFEIPRSAWSAEISRDYTERTRINTSIAQFNVIGSLIFWLTPILLVGVTGTTALTQTSMSAIAWLYAAIMPTSLIVAALIVPSGKKLSAGDLRLVDVVRSTTRNRPFIWYATAMGLWGLGQGVSLSVTILFISDRMRLAAAFPLLMIVFFAATVLAIPGWMRLVPSIGRHRVWAISLVANALARPLVLLVAPGAHALWPMLFITIINATAGAPWNFAPATILSDVIDYDLWKTRTNKAGNLFALNTLLLKVTMAIGAGASFVVLGLFHYRVGRPNAGLPELGLISVYMVIPGVFHVAAAALGWTFPLDKRRHDIVRKRLESRFRRTVGAKK